MSNVHTSFACFVDKFGRFASVSCHVELRRVAEVLEESGVFLCVLEGQRCSGLVEPCGMFESVDGSGVFAAGYEEA